MINRISTGVLLCLFLSIGKSVYAGSSGLEKFGDFANIAMPLAALGFTGIHKDKQGAIQFVKSFALTIGSVYALKPIVNEERPNGGKWSFPSGHTASAFSSASFLQMRYGWKYGIPAYTLAAVVGYSRVNARKHFWYDVVAGAAIGVSASYIFTSRYNISAAPYITDDGKGAGININYEFS